MFVDEEMLSNVGEARRGPENLIAGELHLGHIEQDHRHTRGAWDRYNENLELGNQCIYQVR